MEARLPLLTLEEERQLFGPYDRNARKALERFGVRWLAREGVLRIQGPEPAVALLASRLGTLLEKIRSGEDLTQEGIEEALFEDGASLGNPGTIWSPPSPTRLEKSRMPQPRTEAQKRYQEAMEHKDLIFADGPSGTGKTFLAVAAAVRQLQENRVRRLVLTRPAVEAGERLGFLPGDFEAKVDPYLRPLYDALHDCLGPAGTRRFRDLEVVEIAPLAFMRGRTLNHAFVILDEAQNATASQLKMFLTRLGESTRAVVTGDRTQTDLEEGRTGLADALRRLQGVQGVAVIRFGKEDIQRSPLVQRIVEAYGDES
ncbi:MAG: PhoH family protein [Planctomycetota bacterium]